MKLTVFFICALALQVSAATSFAQKVTLNEKDAPLRKVFNDLKKQTGYIFLYEDKALDNTASVTFSVSNVEFKDVLDICLSDQPLAYTVAGNMVAVKRKDPAIEQQKEPLRAGQGLVTVTGKVFDLTGLPIPGVNVREKGTQNGTITDNKGYYSLSIIGDKSVISFSYIGYETQELAAKDLPIGSIIKLKAAENNLQEVVISKGYYDEKRELSTGDVGVVTAKEIQEQPVSDPIQALIGRVAGLNIQQTSGVPGAYAKIQIRGQNSIANGNDPLYIIDGVPFSSKSLSNQGMPAGGGLGAPTSLQNTGAGLSPFNALNPDDIENIEVLKDAEATAIYGSRGANGVVLITTKKGKTGDTKFNFDASQGVSQVSHFLNMLNTQQYLAMRRDAYRNDGISNIPTDAYDINGVWDTTRYTNWQKVAIGNTAQFTNIQGSLSGGTTNTQFLVSAGYNRQSTVFLGDAADTKGSVHLNLNHSSTNQKFHILLSASYINDNNNLPATDLSSYLTLAPDAPALYNSDGSINWQVHNGTATFGNPLAITLRTVNAITNNLVSNLDLSYEFLPGLTFKTSLGYTNNNLNQVSITPSTSIRPPFNEDPNNRSSEVGYTTFQTWIIEPQLSYQKKIAKGTLNMLIGTTFERDKTQAFATGAAGFASDALLSNLLAGEYTSIATDNYTLYDYNAIYGRLGYDWEGKYLLNITARRDGSSRFGPGKQFGNFGAIGTGWVFSKEKVVKDNMTWLSFGKLRASYGLTGSDQIADYQYLSTYSANSTTYQGLTELYPTGLTNPNFAWETVKKLEGGLDLGFLNDKINLSVSYYRDRSGNQLVTYPLPTVTGFTNVQYNLPAVVQNTGLEIVLNTINIKSKDFTWSTSANFTLPKNKLISYPGLASSVYAYRYVVGQPLSITGVYQYTGVSPQSGLYTFANKSGSGTPSDPEDVVISPPITQTFYGSIINNFKYGQFSLDIVFRFVKQLGFDYRTYFQSPGQQNENQPTNVLTAWHAIGQVSNVQRFGTGADVNNSTSILASSTAVITDASFIRLQNIGLNYSLPGSWQQRLHIQNASLFIRGQNLYTLTKYVGLDPETGSGGLPPLRTITTGITASF